MKEKSLSVPSAGARNSRIELLRIISMLLIVAFHATSMGYLETDRPIIVRAAAVLLGTWGILGVNIFVIISAYFLTDQKCRSKRLVSLVFQVFTYFVLWLILSVAYKYFDTHSFAEALKAVAVKIFNGAFDPFWNRTYWFVTAYFFMLLASPFMNYLLHHADRRLIGKILIVASIIPVYSQFQKNAVIDSAVLCYIYLLTGALKLHFSDFANRIANTRNIVLLFSAALVGRLILQIPDFPDSLNKICYYTIGATDRHAVILLALALPICFSVFSQKPFYSGAVNRVAALTFGVYLLTELYVLDYYGIQEYIFKKFTWMGFITDGILFPLQYAAVVLLVFLLGIGVEFFRDLVLQKPFMKFIEKHFSANLQKADDWLYLE
ncbi:MAG: acyltransferase [Clostridia bacterium]|nr:acyltransferase [Clostridia bacterium]